MQREAAAVAHQSLTTVAAELAGRDTEYASAVAVVQAIEQESDANRAAVLSAATTVAALRQARDHATATGERVAAEVERLDAEAHDLQGEVTTADATYEETGRQLADARANHARLVGERTETEATLDDLRTERAELAESIAARERAIATAEGRLRSLEELEASRATFGDAARFLLSDSAASFERRGAVADHLVVERSFERAVDALLGDLLQHVLVDRPQDVAQALDVLGRTNAGRCGFLVLSEAAGAATASPPIVVPPGARTLDSVVHATGPYSRAVSRILPSALVVPTVDDAQRMSAVVSVPVAAVTGEVYNAPWLVEGGSRSDIRGILETRAELLVVRDDLSAMTAERARLVSEIAAMTERVAAAEQRLATVSGGQHDCEKTIVRLEAQTSQANDERERLRRRLELVFTEHSRAAEERQTVSDRQEEAARAIVLHESQQREAEASLSSIVGRLQTARDRAESCLRLVNESRTEQAGLVERAAALDADVSRLEAAALELEERLAGRKAELDRNDTRRHDVQQSMADAARLLDEDVVTLDALKVEVRAVDEEVSALRNEFTERDHGLKAARHALDGVRTQVMQAELRRAQAASDSAHLAMACLDTTGVPLDEVIGAVERMEDAGELVGPARRGSALPDEDDESEDEAEGAGTPEPSDVSASSQIDPD
jgi:chromosome segregation protein